MNRRRPRHRRSSRLDPCHVPTTIRRALARVQAHLPRTNDTAPVSPGTDPAVRAPIATARRRIAVRCVTRGRSRREERIQKTTE